MLGAAVALAAATVLPAASVFAANALNPLTERSLLLSSSAPGYMETDGSGNSEGSPNAIGESYAAPGSGPNGKKTGQTFSFRVSSDSTAPADPVKGLSLQYCTTAAGLCRAPGNNAEGESNAAAHVKANPTSDLEIVGEFTEGAGAGQFQVFLEDTNGDLQPTSGWSMSAKNVEDAGHSQYLTGKDNFITLVNTTGITSGSNDQIQVVFRPSSSIYITNPGADEFFVKINTYSTDDDEDGMLPDTDENIIDGGVTVANVMTESIHITTKVLETMSFSVGTQNPDTQAVQHGSCDAINVVNGNRLNLGNQDAEYSLETGRAHEVFSYWRLSSNSSGGATVYYSGDTLRNTVGDHIADMPNKAHSQPGTEQFGLALIDAGQDDFDDEEEEGQPVRPFPANHPINLVGVEPGRDSWIHPLNIVSDYADGGYDEEGNLLPISNGVGSNGGQVSDNGEFKFLASSMETPEVIAQNNDQVVSCATSKVRYIGNIAANTPAGVYTTKINYLAAPQY